MEIWSDILLMLASVIIGQGINYYGLFLFCLKNLYYKRIIFYILIKPQNMIYGIIMNYVILLQ